MTNGQTPNPREPPPAAAAVFGLGYFKRYRMELELSRRNLEPPRLPPSYSWLPWDLSLIDLHAEVKYHSFREEMDSSVFPCLGDWDGCRRLMREIARKEGFLPEATWLAACVSPEGHHHSCGTIQGVLELGVIGSIQNLGVVPQHRGHGLGRALLLKALHGFQQCGATRVCLEVTVQNSNALQLYRSVGFRRVRTVYKTVEAAVAMT